MPNILSLSLGMGMGGSTPWYAANGIDPSSIQGIYVAKGAASLAASYSNLANPGTNDLTVGVAPTFNTATGWTFNGTSQYLNAMTGAGFTWSAVIRYSGATNLASSPSVFGSQNNTSTRGFYISLVGTGGSQGIKYTNGAIGSAVAPTPAASGVIGIGGNQGYKNGTADGSTLSDGTGNAVSRLYIGALNYADIIPITYYAGNILAAAFYNTTLTAAQMLAVSTAMAAL